VLIEIGGVRKPSEFFYKKALDEARLAIRCSSNEGEPYFYEALALCELKQYEAANKSFELCIANDPNNLVAKRNKELIENWIKDTHVDRKSSNMLVVVSFALLIALWSAFFTFGKPGETVLGTMSTLLLGFVLAAVLLPWLTRLKLPGVEFDLSQRDDKTTGRVPFDIEYGRGLTQSPSLGPMGAANPKRDLPSASSSGASSVRPQDTLAA
jgi:hypothetical protein